MAALSADGRHKFNNDLLLDEEDRAKARKNWPRVAEAFIDEGLAQRFIEMDCQANASKKRSRMSGRAAVYLGVLALIGMSSSGLWEQVPSPWPTVLDGFAALLGIASVLIAFFGILHSAGKRRWLMARWQTERMRQFNFQYNVAHISDVVAAAVSSEALHTLHQARAHELSIDVPTEEGLVQERLADTLTIQPKQRVWLTHRPVHIKKSDLDPGCVDEFVDAYRYLRIRHQISYAQHVLGRKSGPLRSTLQQQQHGLERLATSCILILFGLHLLVVGGVLLGWPGWLVDISHSPWAHAIAIWLAAIALGARVLEGGYGLRVDSARYSDYLFNLTCLEEDYERDSSLTHRLAVMRRVEELSFQEMVSFLRSASAAQYVI